MFKTEANVMNMDLSKQRDFFCGVIGLLAISALACAAAGSSAGFVALAVIIALLCTRKQWTRILTLVIAAYSGFISALTVLMGRGQVSFVAFIALLISGGIFWLLLRPGMDVYFGTAPAAVPRVVQVPPAPGALPHLRSTVAPAQTVSGAPTSTAASTQQQWERLQQQLRAEREKEEREAEEETRQAREPFPVLSLIFTVLVYAYAVSVGGPVGTFSLVVAIPGLIAAMLRAIPPRAFVLSILIGSGALILVPEWNIVAPRLQTLLQHHGPYIFGAIALLAYLIAMGIAGLENGENHA